MHREPPSRADRRFMMFVSPFIAGYGVFVAATGRLGRGPLPVGGPIPPVVGGCYVVAAVAVFLMAWLGQPSGKDRPPGRPPVD